MAKKAGMRSPKAKKAVAKKAATKKKAHTKKKAVPQTAKKVAAASNKNHHLRNETMTEESGERVPFAKRDSSEIASKLAEVLDKFAFHTDDPPVSSEAEWSELSAECREVISAEMLNDPQECSISKCGNASIVLATCQVETGGGYGVWERCFAYQYHPSAKWQLLWYEREDTD